MRRRKSTIFFVVLGICLISLAAALQVGWILLNLQQIALLVLGILFFALLITGLVLNTAFLVREIRKSEQQDAFLNAMTHELKTPIASIRLYLETLQKRELSKEKREAFYEIMLADSDRLLGTIEQVLAASKARERSRKPKVANVDLRALVEDCVSQISNRYKLPADTIRVTGASEPLLVEADRSELETVFLNLLDNAVKYSGKTVEIAVKLRRRQTGVVEVHVKDKGIGIPANEVKSIFKRFYRVASGTPATPKGTGLGLYIVRSIVESHGGRIFVKSKGEGLGSTFIVRLPAS
jgi:signal transduction histidine kinase